MIKNTKIWHEMRHVYYLVVVYPVQEVFLRGWWRGMQFKDICAALTGASSDFWGDHTLECYDVVFRDFSSLLAYIHFGLYMFLILYILVRLVRMCRL